MTDQPSDPPDNEDNWLTWDKHLFEEAVEEGVDEVPTDEEQEEDN